MSQMLALEYARSHFPCSLARLHRSSGSGFAPSHKAGNLNSEPDIDEFFALLGLQKYLPLFKKEDVDFATLVTMKEVGPWPAQRNDGPAWMLPASLLVEQFKLQAAIHSETLLRRLFKYAHSLFHLLARVPTCAAYA